MICNDLFAKRINEWEVLPGVIQYDHNLIKFSVSYKENVTVEKTFFFDKANWKKFQEQMKSSDERIPLPECWSRADLEREYKAFVKDINSAMRRNIPYGPKKRRESEARFWTKELNRKRRELRNAFKVWYVDRGNLELHGNYTFLKNSYKTDVKKAKHSAICDRVESLMNVKEMSKFVRIYQGIENKTLDMLQKTKR